ncbi:MAG TPA: UDP-N-acetylmuramoyl-L-alanyl-D-glutamate--2,6-diaminopimelate ligase [Tepidisphaeraceae bacterium]|nr:UDP-N-acetylmuramoyl-L-alanyl-D-glutamate--2,6-diaminopimelate ligase [Tepidisphaeraceae bacterium]
MLLRDLFQQFDPTLNLMRLPDARVTAVTEDSRRVVPGSIFVARAGTVTDGSRYIADAARRGAVVVVAGQTVAGARVPIIVVPDPAAATSILAHKLAGNPSHSMNVIGVTGTNGKTTVTYLIRQILNHFEKKCGMIGTVEIDDGQKTFLSDMTTPAAVDVAAMLGRMRDHGCDACAMETSSHALCQGRVAAVRYSAAVFTNLTGDHLDYHGSMDDYAAAKSRLFSMLDQDGVAIVNADDAWSVRMLKDCKSVHPLRFGIRNRADYMARDLSFTAAGTQFVLDTPDGCTPVKTRLIGRHNVENVLAAAAVCAELFGLTVHQLANVFQDLTGAPGRLQRVDAGQPFTVLVDYAHTDDALRNVLSALRPICRGKLHVLFGAGGDRDRTKRPRMASVVAQFADTMIITSDNPRTENPRAIIDEILSGLPADRRESVTVEPDRRVAISMILSQPGPSDVVLIAGKGHENYQILGIERTHFDDCEEVRSLLQGS